MAIAFINSVAASGSALPALNVTTGNLVVVGVRWSGTLSVSKITDTAGNIYTRITGRQAISNVSCADLWYCRNAVGNAANVITATFSAGAGSPWMAAAQYSGLSTTSALDVFVRASNASASSTTSPAFTTASANEVIVVYASVNNTGGVWTCAGCTQRAIDSNAVNVLFDNIVSSVQTGVTQAMSCTAGNAIIQLIATFATADQKPIVAVSGVTHNAVQSGATVTLPAFIAVAGNLIVVAARWNAAVTISSVTDTAGNTYTRVNGVTGVGVISAGDLWYSRTTAGHVANVVSLNFSGATANCWATAGQWAGVLSTGSVVDQNVTASSASSATCTTAAFTTTAANELLVDFSSVNTNAGLAEPFSAAGFNRRTQSDDGVITMLEQIVTTIQTGATVTTTCTSGSNIFALVATFKAGVAGPTVPTFPALTVAA